MTPVTRLKTRWKCQGLSPAAAASSARLGIFSAASIFPASVDDQRSVRLRLRGMLGMTPPASAETGSLGIGPGRIEGDVGAPWPARLARRPAINAGRADRVVEDSVGGRIAPSTAVQRERVGVERPLGQRRFRSGPICGVVDFKVIDFAIIIASPCGCLKDAKRRRTRSVSA